MLLFFGDALTTLCLSFLIWYGVPETRPPYQEKQKKRFGQLHLLHNAITDPWLWSYSLVGLLFDIIYLQQMTTMPLDMQMHGLSPLAYGSVMAINAIEVVLISLPLTAFFNRHSLR